MKVSTRRRIYLAATALGVVLSTPAFAQGAEGGEMDASDIVVTARRVEERLQDVPISISVFSQGQLDNRNITTASDLAVYTPSLSSNNRFGSDKSSFTIRGFNQDGKTAPTVAVYFADVVAIRANSGTGGSNGTGPGSFFDLQNVQVLKGPQGTLFGRNTTGGAILLVPQKPTDRLEGYVEGSVGNYDLKRIQAVINIPLADTFKVRLGVDRQKRDGYLHNKSGIGPDRFADSDYVAVRASALAELTPSLENYLIATYNRTDTNGAMFRITACNRGPGLTGRPATYAPLACDQIDRQARRGDGFYDVENVFPNPGNTITQWQVINTTTWTASDNVTIKNIASYGEFRERTLGSIGGEFWIPRTGPAAGIPIGNTLTLPWQNRYNNIQSAFTEELQFQGRSFENRLVWQAGAYLELSNPMGAGDTTVSLSTMSCSDIYGNRCAIALAGGGYGLIYNQIRNRNIGLYAQGTFAITDKLAVTAGARYTSDRMTGNGGRLQLVFNTPNVITSTSCSNPKYTTRPGNLDPRQCNSINHSNSSSKPTWVIDLEYKPISDVMVYGKYSRGYRQGGVDPSVIGLESWNPERVDTYEVGAKTSFSGGLRGYFNFAAFYNDFRNQQLSLTVVGCTIATCGFNSGIGGARAIINAGKSRIWGIEADASVTAFDSLKLDVGYAYLNTRLQEIVPPQLPAGSPYNPPAVPRAGIDLPLSPKHRVTLTGTYTLPLDESIGRISLSATYVYTDTQLASIDVGPYSLLPSSNLVNLNLNWNSVAGLPVDLSAFVTNLTKEKFAVNVTNTYVANGFEASIPNMPRMYGLRLRYRFGS